VNAPPSERISSPTAWPPGSSRSPPSACRAAPPTSRRPKPSTGVVPGAISQGPRVSSRMSEP
jgi:hypothetical protein